MKKDVTFLQKGMMTYSCLHGMIMKKIKQYRKNTVCTEKEKTMVYNMKREIEIANMDNISRTQCYQEYYVRNSEIRWAFFSEYGLEKCGVEYD